MFKIVHNEVVGRVAYDTEAHAWRAVHELLEETFGYLYDEDDVNEYDVVPA